MRQARTLQKGGKGGIVKGIVRGEKGKGMGVCVYSETESLNLFQGPV